MLIKYDEYDIKRRSHRRDNYTHNGEDIYMIPLTFNFVHWNYNFTPSYTLLVLLSVDYDNQGLGGGERKINVAFMLANAKLRNDHVFTGI